MGVEIGTGMLVSSLVGAGTSILGGRSQKKAADKAAKATTGSIDKQIAIEQENEARRRQEWQQTQDANRAMWESEVAREQGNMNRDYSRAVSLDSEDRRRYEKLNPYREAGRAALGDLQQRMTGSMKDLAGLGGV
jgi:hypothetical protein